MTINSGDTAWVLASAALVLLMTPGLAFFYGGMVRAKSVLNMMMMSFGAMASISVVWILWGYSEAFGDAWHGLVGNPFQHFGLSGLLGDAAFGAKGDLIPALAFVAFQAVFAIITVALISGAIADRAKFAAWMVFTVVWATLVYFPVAHWVFAFDGSRPTRAAGSPTSSGAIDFAGGTAVHINAGAAGLALALVLGKRVGFGKEPMRPHNLTARHARRRPAVVRLVRLQRRLGARRQRHRRPRLGQHPWPRPRAAALGWLARRADPRRARHLPRRRLRRRRGPGRHHPGLLRSVTPVGAIVLGLLAGVSAPWPWA